jgi:WD40 repeat protein
MRIFKTKSRWVTALAFSPNGKALAAGSYLRLDVWDVAAGTVDSGEMVFWGALSGSLRFDAKGRVILGVGYNGGLRIITPGTWAVAETSKFDSNMVAVSPAGLVLVGGGRIGAFGLTAKGLGARKWTKPIAGHGILDGLDFYPDGDRFATVETQHVKGTDRDLRAVVRVRAARNGSELDEAESVGPKGGLLRVSPDGEWVAFASAKNLIVHNAADLARAVKVPSPNKKPVVGLAFHPSGRYLATVSGDTAVRLHDRDANWAVTRTFDWEVRTLKSVAFSPDGTLGAAGGEKGQVVVWDVDE